MENRKLSLFNKVAVAANQIRFTDYMTNTWLMYYFTTFLGVHIAVVTLLFTVSKFIGAFITPIYGYISDRLYLTKFGQHFGRRRSLLVIGIPLVTILFITMWIPNLPIPLYYLFFILHNLATPLISTAANTFMAEMTESSSERAELVGYNQIGGAISGVMASFLSIYLFNIFGDKTWSGYFIIAVIYDILTLFFALIFYFGVYERPVDPSTILERTGKMKKNPASSIIWNFFSTTKVRSYRLYLYLYLCEQMFRSLLGQITTYFVIFVLLLDPKSVAVSHGVGLVSGILFVIFFIWLAARTNGPFTYRIGAWITIAVMLSMIALVYLRPSHLILWFVVLTVILNLGKTGVVNSTQFMLTMIPDVDEMVTAKRREGEYSGVNTTLDVIFSTLDSLFVGILLSVSGFAEKSQVQATNTTHAILFLYTIVPIILCLIGIIVSYRFKLDIPRHKILLNEIIRRRNGGKVEDVSPDTKKVVENLTGLSYEKCWGNNIIMDFGRKYND